MAKNLQKQLPASHSPFQCWKIVKFKLLSHEKCYINIAQGWGGANLIQISSIQISSTKLLRQQFIRHRVQLITDITSPSTWRFCPTTSNPADIITRGLDTKAFISKEEYWNQGPSWLLRQPQEWPSTTIGEIQDTEYTVDTTSIITNIASTQDKTNLLNVIDITRYSTLNKTLRITALVIHFTRKLRGKTNSRNTITAMDMNYACVTLVKYVQQIHYGDIISKLKHKDKPQTKRPPIIQQLGLYLDGNNLIRCKGRPQNTQLPYNAKYPVMIPAESYLETLIARDTHLIFLHGGVRDTLTRLFQSYWIPKGRQLVKTLPYRSITGGS